MYTFARTSIALGKQSGAFRNVTRLMSSSTPQSHHTTSPTPTTTHSLVGRDITQGYPLRSHYLLHMWLISSTVTMTKYRNYVLTDSHGNPHPPALFKGRKVVLVGVANTPVSNHYIVCVLLPSPLSFPPFSLLSRTFFLFHLFILRSFSFHTLDL